MSIRVLVVATLAWLSPLWADADTTTTVYRYNADGALTSIVETSDGGSKTTYFTWDNFDAAKGTPTAANGNLIGIGTMEGGDSIQSLAYDNLDRLVRVTNHHDDTAAVYEYYPDELLAASLNANAPASDGLQHYYSESRYPQVTNLYDRHTGELSSRHRRIRYLEDGTEQMLVRHRKDVDGVYNLGNQTMSGYAYDPYGASLEQEPTGSPPAGPLYSVRNNPYRYTQELQDPVSGAYYLRARWYLPGHQTFLQRDPFPNLNRYGYANGNPITNYDPSGRSAKPFVRGLEAFGMSALAGFTGGLSVYVEDVVDHRAFFGRDPTRDFESSLQLVMTGAAALSFLGGVVGGLASRTLAFGAVGGLVQGGFQVTRHPADMGHVAIGFLGGAVGGFALGLVGGAIGKWRQSGRPDPVEDPDPEPAPVNQRRAERTRQWLKAKLPNNPRKLDTFGPVLEEFEDLRDPRGSELLDDAVGADRGFRPANPKVTNAPPAHPMVVTLHDLEFVEPKELQQVMRWMADDGANREKVVDRVGRATRSRRPQSDEEQLQRNRENAEAIQVKQIVEHLLRF